MGPGLKGAIIIETIIQVLVGLIVIVYILILVSLAKMELKTGYKLMIALGEVLLMLIIAASFGILMFIFYSDSQRTGLCRE